MRGDHAHKCWGYLCTESELRAHHVSASHALSSGERKDEAGLPPDLPRVAGARALAPCRVGAAESCDDVVCEAIVRRDRLVYVEPHTDGTRGRTDDEATPVTNGRVACAGGGCSCCEGGSATVGRRSGGTLGGGSDGSRGW